MTYIHKIDTVLGIDTSCDDTAVALFFPIKGSVLEKKKTQGIHSKYFGVVPEIASREHLINLPILTRELIEEAGIGFRDISALGVTCKPGLIGSILVGLSFAKALSYSLGKPVVGIDHIEGHLYSAFLSNEEPEYPFLGLILSGGHSEILLVKGFEDYELISTTVDDAAGEALDKIARYLKLGFPGGPEIEKRAEMGDRKRFTLPLPVVKKNPYNFSFSGLKTSALAICQREEEINDGFINDLSACFLDAIVKQILDRVKKAIELTGCKTLVLGGGVAANKLLRSTLSENFNKDIRIYYPRLEDCMDNASMIALLTYLKMRNGHSSDLTLGASSISQIGKRLA